MNQTDLIKELVELAKVENTIVDLLESQDQLKTDIKANKQLARDNEICLTKLKTKFEENFFNKTDQIDLMQAVNVLKKLNEAGFEIVGKV